MAVTKSPSLFVPGPWGRHRGFSGMQGSRASLPAVFGLPVLPPKPAYPVNQQPVHPPEWEPHLQMSSSWIIERLWEWQWRWLTQLPYWSVRYSQCQWVLQKPIQGLTNSQGISGGLTDTPDKQNILLGLNTHQDFTFLILWHLNLNRLVSTAVIPLKYRKRIDIFREQRFVLFSMRP